MKRKKKEMMHLHRLLCEAYQELGVEFDDTEYFDNGVRQTDAHRTEPEHKKAIYLMSKAADRQLDNFDTLGFDVVTDPEPQFDSGDVAYFRERRGDKIVFNYQQQDGDAELQIQNRGAGHYRWAVLEDLKNGSKVDAALSEHYEKPNELDGEPYNGVRSVLNDDGCLPEELVDDVEGLIDYYKDEEGIDEFEPTVKGSRP